jgi:hypothetical protein
MSLTQGEALPNITTTQGQTTTAPSWYTDYLNNLATQGTTGAQGATYAGATPLQQQAFNAASTNVGNYQPALTSATNLANTVGSTNVADNVNNFMNPYTQNVVDAIGTLGQRNIQQNLAPGATAAAVGSGQFGSKRGAEVLGQAINSGLQNINANQAQALQTGYTQALQAAQNQSANQLAASQQLGNLANSTQALGLGDVNAQATLGAQQQQINQNESLFPLQTANTAAGILRGYTVPTSVNSTYTGPIPGAYSASPLAQIAGLGSVLGAVSNTKLGASIGGALGNIDWGSLANGAKSLFNGGTTTVDPTEFTGGTNANGVPVYYDQQTGQYYDTSGKFVPVTGE